MSAPCFVVLGDSFSAGGEPGVRPFPDHLAARLRGWRYLNLAVAGAGSADVLEGQLEPALAAAPDLVSIVCGANDVVRTTRPRIVDFATSLNQILARLRGEAPDALLVTATYPAVSESSPLRPRTRARIASGLEGVNAVVRRLSTHHGAICVELTDHPSRHDRGSYAADGFHPSAAGHRHAAEAFESDLRDRLGIELDREETPA